MHLLLALVATLEQVISNKRKTVLKVDDRFSNIYFHPVSIITAYVLFFGIQVL